MSTGQIGPYELLDQVAAPDGTVWRARDQATGTIVAIRPHPAAPEGTYVVQDWLTGAGIGTLAIAAPAVGAIVVGGLTPGAAGAAGTAAGAGGVGLSGGAGGAAPGAAGLSAGAGPTAAAAGSPTAAAAGATPVPAATSGASGTAAHASGGGGSVGVGQGVPGPGGHAGVSASKGVVGHIVAHKGVAAVAAVVIAGGAIGAAVLVAAGADDEPKRRTASDRSAAPSTEPTATGSAEPTTTGSAEPTSRSPSAPTSATSATPTMREDEVAATEIEGRYNATSAGGTVGGTTIPAGSGETLVLRVVSDCTSGPCTVRVTDGKESLAGTGSYDDGAWSGSGTYTASEIDCTSPFEMTLTPSGRDLTLRFVAGDFCGYGAADLRWTLSPIR